MEEIRNNEGVQVLVDVVESGREIQRGEMRDASLSCQNQMQRKGNSDEESSPRGVLEIPISGSDSDQSSPDGTGSSGNDKSPVERGLATWDISYENLQWKKMLGQMKKKSSMKFSTIPLLGGYGYDLSKKTFRRKHDRNHSAEVASIAPKRSWRNFSYEELKQATDNFSSGRLIGKGGHAEVYKGLLSDGMVVAVKKVLKEEKNEEDRAGDFLSELGIIAHIDHPNTAKLIGFSAEKGLHLVLQFSPHGSLADSLHGSEESMAWKKRYKVAIGIAEGLKYLHSDCHRRIIHRDITASNILLSAEYEAQLLKFNTFDAIHIGSQRKRPLCIIMRIRPRTSDLLDTNLISDFGLAKWLPEKWQHHVVSPIEGTFGYMAPEYFMHGIIHEKTDVFAFGVLLLELLTGRRAVDSYRQSLVMWAKPLLEQNNVIEIADPRLGEDYDVTEMKRAMFVAKICVHHLPNMRPTMNKAVKLLMGENEAIDTKQKSMGMKALLWDSCDLEDYTSTTYQNDLNRHMELVME